MNNGEFRPDTQFQIGMRNIPPASVASPAIQPSPFPARPNSIPNVPQGQGPSPFSPSMNSNYPIQGGIGSSQMMPPSFPIPDEQKGKKTFLFRNKRLTIIALGTSCLVIIALVLVAVYSLNGQANVTLYQVNAKNTSQYVGGGGIIYPRQNLDISYPFPERVIAVMVKPGDQVSTGQALLQLDPTQLNFQVTQASNELSAAQSYLDSVSVNGNSVAVAAAQKQYDLAKSRYDALVAQSSSTLLHNSSLIAPMAGVVTAVNINAGEVFASDTPLITVMDETTVIVHVKIPLTNLAQVHLGQTATVTPSALPSLNLVGTVISIVPIADPQTDTFEVWVEVKNPDKNLLPGMSAFVRIQSVSSGVVVPRMAVINPHLDALVFVVRNDHAYLQHVHISGRSINSVYVDEGLSNGDKVVVIGVDRLKNGQPVHAVKTESA